MKSDPTPSHSLAQSHPSLHAFHPYDDDETHSLDEKSTMTNDAYCNRSVTVWRRLRPTANNDALLLPTRRGAVGYSATAMGTGGCDRPYRPTAFSVLGVTLTPPSTLLCIQLHFCSISFQIFSIAGDYSGAQITEKFSASRRSRNLCCNHGKDRETGFRSWFEIYIGFLLCCFFSSYFRSLETRCRLSKVTFSNHMHIIMSDVYVLQI